MEIISTTVYSFDELSDEAKEKAREWYREVSADDQFWHETPIEEWQSQTLPAMGWSGAKIGYRGFWSQGDGAHFEGTWNSHDVDPEFLTREGWQDPELARFLAAYAALAVKYPKAFCRIKHRGHYEHENCTEFDVEVLDENDDHVDSETRDAFEDEITELSREVMQHIYQSLEKEWEWQNADEQVDETIRANEYTFTGTGRRFG